VQAANAIIAMAAGMATDRRIRVRTDAGLHACSRLPMFRRTVMTMGANLPIAILPGVVAQLGRVFELLLRNTRAESAKRLVDSRRLRVASWSDKGSRSGGR
jgi:hypothetical protein